ncbi:4-alpha-glucanotransferase (amylomaltase) [Clostridiaceae bacterium JG1575]|nr:4-alpha-glucanotransferase (amylomaltase) [Clostridiaceae bacterium JG1575]
MNQRVSGLLMHISSLPGPYGIGDFGPAAYDFVETLKETGTTCWQILPLGITGFGDSPYQSVSAFAGNPYFIDLGALLEEGYLSAEEIEEKKLNDSPESVDYGRLYERKLPLLRAAYARAKESLAPRLEAFLQGEHWLEDFALFMALKTAHGGVSWLQWPKAYRLRDAQALADFREEHAEEVGFWVFTQYYFFQQWSHLKTYANERGVAIVGDIPIYVALDSADLWRDPHLFLLDEALNPVALAGCPPDQFTDEGQLWGNPLYRWDEMAKTGYRWWILRLRESLRLYDWVRIDHFRGFESYWSIPAQAPSARFGRWEKGPGMDLFEALREEFGEMPILAENLGFLTDEVEELIEKTGFPGMNVLVFAFDPYGDSQYLPHHYIKNSVVYTSNHDTPTARGFIEAASEQERAFALAYVAAASEHFAHELMRTAWASVSMMALAPIQDVLNLDSSARFNTPSTLGTNWHWRMRQGALTPQHREYLKELNRIYRRIP